MNPSDLNSEQENKENLQAGSDTAATSQEENPKNNTESEQKPKAETSGGAKKETPVSAQKKLDYENPRFAVASSPHIVTSNSVRGIMLDVIIALCPALIVSTYFFGPRVLIMTLISVVSCVVFEWLYRLVLKKSFSLDDLSACVTGMLLAMCLPVNAPYWLPVVGAFFSVVVVKQLFGGIGKNFLNPALAGRVFLFSFPALMNSFASAGTDFWTSLFGTADAVTSATPMASLHQGILPDLTITQMLLGEHGGSMGEVPALMLILGGIYLLLRRVISWRIPVCYIGTVAVLTFLFPLGGNDRFEWMIANLLCGGLLLGAIFMATDYVTSPVTVKGQFIYAIGCGALTVFLRYFGTYPEGVSFSILIMNACVPLFDKAGMPHRFGTPHFWQRKKGVKSE